MVSPEYAPGHGTSALLADVADLLDRARTALGGTAGAELSRLQATLHEPLTLAVVGHTNAGKSTLVNALIGARVAPTAATECTRVITRFKFGSQQAQLVPRNGEPQPLWLTPEGRVPDTLPLRPDQVAHIEVSLSFEPLRNLTVIDTPGLSGDKDLANETERLLGLVNEVEENEETEQVLGGDSADALLFVFGAALKETERDILRRFRRMTRRPFDFPANALGVLSKADRLGGEDHQTPRAAAAAKARAHTGELADYVAGVLPVMGKIAETTEAGAFNETHAGWLRTIAAMPEADREDALSYANAFRESSILNRSARQDLLDRLDLYGIEVLTRPEQAHAPATAMQETLRDLSGIAALRERLDILCVRPAAVHKVARALAGVEKLVDASGLPESKYAPLLDHIETIRLSDPMHRLAELRALTALYTGRCSLGDPAQHRALALFERIDPAERLGVDARVGSAALAETAAAEAAFWRTYANGGGPLLARRTAETAERSAYLISTGLENER
jgi:energy-coupling factor transporter ATP-binding protein EcfA2